MKILTFFLLVIFLVVSVQAQEVKGLGGVGEVSAKADRPIDVGVELSKDPYIHQAVYAVLEKKGVSCTGLSTKKDGTVTILQSSSDDPKITVAEIQAEIDKIKLAQEYEAKIEKRIRELAIADLKAKGEIPQDYK